MPIRTAVTALALLAVVCLVKENGAQAFSPAKMVKSVVTTTGDLSLHRAKYRIITTGATSSTASTAKPKDVFRLIFRGMQFMDGDSLSFSLVGPDGRVDLGSPTFTGTNPALTLINRRARGVIGESPYIFLKAKLRYNPRRTRLMFMSGKGLAQMAPIISALGTTQNNPIDVIVHVRRPGIGDADFTFNGLFKIRHSIKRRTQMHVYKGVAK